MELQNFMETKTYTYRVPLWWFRTYSTLVQTYTYDLFFFTFSNNPALGSNSLYIWFEHYTHKVAGSRLFDHKKPSAMPSCLIIVASCFRVLFFTFCYFLLPFLLLVTFVNYFLLLKGSKVSYFNLFFDCSRGGGAPLFIYLDFLYYWGGGGGG